jgi:hypothetical protein
VYRFSGHRQGRIANRQKRRELLPPELSSTGQHVLAHTIVTIVLLVAVLALALTLFVSPPTPRNSTRGADSPSMLGVSYFPAQIEGTRKESTDARAT